MNVDVPRMTAAASLALTAFVSLLVGCSAAGTGVGVSPSSRQDFIDAYVGLFPLYEMARLRYQAIENTSNPNRHDLHSFRHSRRLADHTARTVTAPNNDTLYSSARLDLRYGPVLVELPAMEGRYYSLHVMNFHTDNLAVIGQHSDGNGPLRVALVGPDWGGATPEQSRVVRSDTHDIWVLVRTLVDGEQDIARAARLQNSMRITAPRSHETYPKQITAPVDKPKPEQFLAVINEFLQRNPPQGRAAELVRIADRLGVRRGETRVFAALPETIRSGWETAWSDAQASLMKPMTLYTRQVSGWKYPPPEVGRWGNNLVLRATVALRGIAALDPSEALYLSTFVDHEGQTLDGGRHYRVRIPPGGLPAAGFWSMTMYEVLPDGRFFLTANPIRRYSIGNRTQGLVMNPDRSIDIVIQHQPPVLAHDMANWLPAPAGAFRLTLRAYLPSPELVEARVPLPRVERAHWR